jgi:3-deoxy-D-manno-octulosonic-acid transferase
MSASDASAGMHRPSLSAQVYRALTTAGLPLIQLFIQHRVMRGKEEPTRIDERRGLASIRRPDGPLVWLHAASNGEAQSVLVLVEQLLNATPDLNILMTTGTVTSARIMGDRLPKRAIHQYVPIDRATWVRRFLDYWRPDAGIWVESELWPNLLIESRRRGVAMALVNARMSEASFSGWRRAPALARELLSCFELVLAQDDTIAGRLRELGADPVSVTGNLKLAAAPLPATAGGLIELQDMIAGRTVWLAASTHRGEEQIVADTHRNLADRFPGLLTLLAPRHPNRGGEVEDLLKRAGLTVARRSRGERITAETDVYLVDATGLLGQLYRVSPLAFVGGSLVAHGGHNMLEPAILHCAVLHGPHVHNFRSIADELAAAGASLEVADGPALSRTLAEFLGAPKRIESIAEAGVHAAERKQEVLGTVMAELQPLVARAIARTR